MTSNTDRVERKYGHHKPVGGLVCEFRDVLRVERHLTLRSNGPTDRHRNGESCVGAKIRSGQHHSFLVPSRVSTVSLSISACSQSSIPSNLCAMISLMWTTALRIPCPEVCSCLHAHLQHHVDARRDSARHSGAARSLVGSEKDLRSLLAHQQSQRQPSRIRVLRCHCWMTRSSVRGSMAGRVFVFGHCRRDIHSQDHGWSHVHKYKNSQTNTVT